MKTTAQTTGLADKARSAMRADNHSVLAQMIRYGFVSGLALVVDFGTMYVCIHGFHLPVLWSTTIGFALGIVVNFITSSLWVFPESPRRRSVEVGLFLLVGVTGLLLNDLIVWFCHEKLGIWAMVSKMISTAIVFFWNFLLRRHLIYNPKEENV
ncbi:hypothetical protein GCM10027418_09530 [Mariniluteicoccus endophyticus]